MGIKEKYKEHKNMDFPTKLLENWLKAKRDESYKYQINKTEQGKVMV